MGEQHGGGEADLNDVLAAVRQIINLMPRFAYPVEVVAELTGLPESEVWRQIDAGELVPVPGIPDTAGIVIPRAELERRFGGAQ